MAPTVEEPPKRRYTIGFKDGGTVQIRADTISKPSGPVPFYRLKLDGAIVGEFASGDVSGWWIDDENSD